MENTGKNLNLDFEAIAGASQVGNITTQTTQADGYGLLFTAEQLMMIKMMMQQVITGNPSLTPGVETTPEEQNPAFGKGERTGPKQATARVEVGKKKEIVVIEDAPTEFEKEKLYSDENDEVTYYPPSAAEMIAKQQAKIDVLERELNELRELKKMMLK